MRNTGNTVTDKIGQLIFSCMLRDSAPCYVRPSVHPMVAHSIPFLSFFGVFERFELTAPAQMPHSDFLRKCTCPHACDKGSRVSIELVLKFTIQTDDKRSFNVLPNANAKDHGSVIAPT